MSIARCFIWKDIKLTSKILSNVALLAGAISLLSCKKWHTILIRNPIPLKANVQTWIADCLTDRFSCPSNCCCCRKRLNCCLRVRSCPCATDNTSTDNNNKIGTEDVLTLTIMNAFLNKFNLWNRQINTQ